MKRLRYSRAIAAGQKIGARVEVAEDGFQAKFFHRVMFYGDVQLGSVQKEVEITKGASSSILVSMMQPYVM